MPTMMCCCASCLIGEDDFNRDDSDTLGGKWIEKTGDWDISGGTLVSTVDGVVLTTFRQARPRNTTYNYRVEVDLLDTSTSWGIICKYISADNYDWIELVNTTDVVLPTFWRRRGGTDTLVMSIATHPSGTALSTAMPASLKVTMCYSEVEWSIFSETALGTQLWTTCDVETATTLPVDATVGFVGFTKGDFDNWIYYYHYLSNRICDGCDCSCVNPVDETDYKCVPECLLLTLTPVVNDLDCTSSPGDITMKMRQSSPIANDPPPPTYLKNTIKKYWYSDTVIFYEQLYYSGDEHFWFRLECLSPGHFELVAMDYRAFDTTISGNRANFQSLDGPNTGTLSTSVTCNPIVITFSRFLKLVRQFTMGGPFLCDPLSSLEYSTTITECAEDSPFLADFGWTANNLIEDLIA